MDLSWGFGELFAASLVVAGAATGLCALKADDILARLAFYRVYDNKTAFGTYEIFIKIDCAIRNWCELTALIVGAVHGAVSSGGVATNQAHFKERLGCFDVVANFIFNLIVNHMQLTPDVFPIQSSIWFCALEVLQCWNIIKVISGKCRLIMGLVRSSVVVSRVAEASFMIVDGIPIVSWGLSESMWNGCLANDDLIWTSISNIGVIGILRFFNIDTDIGKAYHTIWALCHWTS